jgi:FHA domain/Bacterial Ig domain
MPNTKLIINGERDFNLGEGIVSLGRVSDNSISFPDDSNVSRFHVEIEPRDGDFWLIELGSSNGTTVNGKPVTTETLLKDGDEILLGGTSQIVFEVEKEKSETGSVGGSPQNLTDSEETKADSATDKAETEIVEDSEKTSKMPVMLIGMGVICGLAVVLAVGAVIYSYNSGNKCEASATIISPGNGQTLSKSTEIRADVKSNGECVQRVIFTLEDKEIASADGEPYKAQLEPGTFAGYASDGRQHNLKVVLEDAEGNKIPQQGGVGLYFDSLATPTPTPEETPDTTPTPKKTQNPNKTLTIKDTQEMLKQLNSQFSPALNYKCDIACLQEIQKKANEYITSEGYSERAKGKDGELSDTINVAFVKEMNLPAPLGYFLAMSRSKFNLQKQGDGEGLWRLSNQFAVDNSLNGMCGSETLSDPSQVCASRVTAWYLSKYLMPLFENDVIYSVAAFGMSPTDAAKWKEGLPPNREDFWNVIKNTQQRDEVIRFLTAGIVTQNPQRFGLKKDQPMAELYKIAMGGQ